MGAERQKGKFLIFRFWRCQILGMKSLTCLGFSMGCEKRLNAPSNFDGSAGDNL